MPNPSELERQREEHPLADKTVNITEQHLFHTPQSMTELENWVLALPADTRIHAITAMWMYNNLLASAKAVEIER